MQSTCVRVCVCMCISMWASRHREGGAHEIHVIKTRYIPRSLFSPFEDATLEPEAAITLSQGGHHPHHAVITCTYNNRQEWGPLVHDEDWKKIVRAQCGKVKVWGIYGECVYVCVGVPIVTDLQESQWHCPLGSTKKNWICVYPVRI